MNVQLHYTPSAALRRSYLIQTGENLPAQPAITVDLVTLTPEQRAVVDEAGIEYGGKVAMPGIVTGVGTNYEGKPHFVYDTGRNRPGVMTSTDPGDFDEVPTAEQWVALAAERLATRARFQPELDARLAAWQAERDARAVRKRELEEAYQALKIVWLPKIEGMSEEEASASLPEFIRQMEAEMEAAGANFGRRRLSHEKSDHYNRLVKERKAAEAAAAKSAWVEAHGSDHLRRAVACGYDCQRLYVVERAALEAPGFVVDFDEAARWKDRSCPSVAALDARDQAMAWNIGKVMIVWLTNAPQAEVDDDADDSEGYFQPCEAVVIRNYLGRYDLVKVIDTAQ